MNYLRSCFLVLGIILGITLCGAVDTNKNYYIFHASGLVMSSADGTPNLHTFQSADDQVFQFVQSGNYLLVKNRKNGKNVAKTGDWDTEYTTSTANSAQFTIEEVGGDYIKLKCANNNRYLGTDGTAPGNSVYSDKSGNEMLHYWFVREASANIIVTDGLEAAITKAENQLANTAEGTGEGNYTTQNRQVLLNAIDDAQNTLSSKSQTEINAATTQLQNAIKTYNETRNPAFVEGEKYYLVHGGNRLLTNNGGKLQLKEPANSTSQQFTISKLNDGTYAVKNVQNGQYVCASGEYSTALTDNTSTKASHLKIGYAPNEDLFVRLQFASNNLYLGTDGTTDGSGVYSDKSGADGKHYWQLVRVTDFNNQQPYHSFHNGSSATRLGVNWLDEKGNHINAHGGCVLYKDGTYYWFGENYRKAPVKSNGIVCYTSKDLYNWKYECMAYECPNVPLRSDYQDMNYGRTLERPKVMYNPNTNQYVMWVHWENGSGYAASRVAILYSDKITGPYTFVKTMRPRGDEQPSGSRDQTLLYDPEYRVGYHFGSAEENMTMHATLLTDDYLNLSNNWARIFVKKQYEAPAVIKYHGRFIAITSGCTGWDPNAAHASYSELPFEGWNDLGNPCVDANANKTYNSQSNYVFAVPNLYNAYIYMGDRWKGGDYFSDANVGESWHIWLPIDMRTGYPILRFYGEWDLSLFDQLNRYRRVEKFEEGKEYVLLSRNANRIFSDKSGKFMLTEDNDELNTRFRICGNGKGQHLLVNTENGKALSVVAGNLCWEDSTGSNSQLWNITKAGNDGYYYLSPTSNSALVLSNLCATTTANGIAGLAKAGNTLGNRFAFCFDSKKHHYTPISDESDGSYRKWIESLGYEQTTLPAFTAENGTTPTVIVSTSEHTLNIESLADQTVVIYNANGQLAKRFNMRTNEVKALHLPTGVYVVNGLKVTVR
ncbi:MAG: hypothetical protein MJZ02_06815 [Paludibacteraceae bacterium]|nr:hypothetical protein [Paludibacteraceae bacterium]